MNAIREDLLTLANRTTQQRWINPAAEWLQKVVAQAYRAGGKTGATIRDFLNGLWLGHPLHPVLTDATIGFWMAGITLDALETGSHRAGFRRAADTAIGIGVVSALGTAAAGLTDWQYTSGKTRRMGFVHALLNITSTLLFGFSLVARSTRNRPMGKYLALLGFSGLLYSAYLGGDMSYRQKMGVNRAPLPSAFPEDFVAVMAEADLPERQLHKVMVGGYPVVLVRLNQKIYALAATCAHMGGPLAEGTLEGDSVVCPWHGSRYSFSDGKALNGPTTYDEPCLEVQVRNGQIEVRASRLALQEATSA